MGGLLGVADDLFVLRVPLERLFRIDEVSHPRFRGRTVDAMDSMAGACGLGRTHFSSYCRKLFNVAPVDFLTGLRVDAAARLLMESPEVSVTEIAFRCGFQSSQYFAKVFRARQGCSPGAFRRQAVVD